MHFTLWNGNVNNNLHISFLKQNPTRTKAEQRSIVVVLNFISEPDVA